MNFVEIILYGLIFIMGTVFGSFFTLAVYRIPLGEDIVYKHSFCPNCKAKLRFKDLIPIVSYLYLGGKCAYCGQKIRIRYLLLEVFSGIVFLIFALSLKLEIMSLNLDFIIRYFIFLLYIASLFIIAGIDKERVQIQKSLLVFGLVLSFVYMIYVCIQNDNAIYTYVIYLILLIFLLLADTCFLRNKLRNSYAISVTMLVLYMLMFSGTTVTYVTIIITLIAIFVNLAIKKIIEKAKSKVVITTNNNNLKIPIGFYLCVSNILLILVCNFLCNWVM